MAHHHSFLWLLCQISGGLVGFYFYFLKKLILIFYFGEREIVNEYIYRKPIRNAFEKCANLRGQFIYIEGIFTLATIIPSTKHLDWTLGNFLFYFILIFQNYYYYYFLYIYLPHLPFFLILRAYLVLYLSLSNPIILHSIYM